MPIKPLVSHWVRNRLDRKNQRGDYQGEKNTMKNHKKFLTGLSSEKIDFLTRIIYLSMK